MGEFRLGRSVLQPGWRWSESIGPIARTEMCQDHHIGFSVSGGCHVRMREGAEIEIGPSQVYEIPPGHDSWVVGDEPWVSLTWQPSTAFARPEGGSSDQVVATLLFDIVDSTARALELGDGAWRDLLARHDAAVRGLLDRFGGREAATTGDGFVASSTARSARSGRRRKSVARRRRWASTYGPACTPGRSSSRAATCAASGAHRDADRVAGQARRGLCLVGDARAPRRLGHRLH